MHHPHSPDIGGDREGGLGLGPPQLRKVPAQQGHDDVAELLVAPTCIKLTHVIFACVIKLEISLEIM